MGEVDTPKNEPSTDMSKNEEKAGIKPEPFDNRSDSPPYEGEREKEEEYKPLPIRCDHKTVFLLDRTKWFAEDSNSPIPISLKGPGTPSSVAVVEKTLWTWAIEALLEFHRIASDLYFDSDRLLRVSVAGSRILSLQREWDKNILKYSELLQDLSRISPPEIDGADCTVINGITAVVESLGKISHQQKKWSDDQWARNKSGVVHNGGSVVILCRLKTEKDVEDLIEKLAKEIHLSNTETIDFNHRGRVVIEKVNLFIIGIHPKGSETDLKYAQDLLKDYPLADGWEDKQINIRCRVETVEASASLCKLIRSVAMDIYDLVSTTVSGIPMKEEAQQGVSVNYDVELLHPKEAHDVLKKLGLCGEGGFLRESIEDYYYTHKLAWSTPSPKNRWQLFPNTLSAVRVTPSSVNSRPSVCLTSFLMAGRNVMLELKREGPAAKIKPNVGHKLISHTLISHQGRIYIHAIDILPKEKTQLEGKFEWPTSINENADSDEDEDEDFEPAYSTAANTAELDNVAEETPDLSIADGTLRTPDLCELIKSCMLRPKKKGEVIPKECRGAPCGQAIRHIRQLTRYWPTTKEDSLIFQTTKFNDIIQLFRKPTLTPADIEQGKKAIARAYALKTAKEQLIKGNVTCNLLEEPKNRDEHYKVAFLELAIYTANYLHYSDNHEVLYRELLSRFELDQQITVNYDDVPMGYDEIPVCENFITEKLATVAASRNASPVPRKIRKPNPVEKINVYDFLCSLQPKIESRPDFVGREEAGKQPAKLYKNIDFSNAPPRGQEAPM